MDNGRYLSITKTINCRLKTFKDSFVSTNWLNFTSFNYQDTKKSICYQNNLFPIKIKVKT